MPVRKYKKIIDDNNKIKYQFIDETSGKIKEVELKGQTKDILFYDVDKKEFLKGKEYDAFLEADEDATLGYEEQTEEEKEIESEIDENHRIISAIENKTNDNIIEQNSELFNGELSESGEVINQGLGLDKSKEFLTQKITPSMFKNGLKFLYEDLQIGHTQSFENLFSLNSLGELKDAAYYKIMNYLYFDTDKNTNRYQKANDKNIKNEEYEKNLNEIADEIQKDKELKGEEFDREAFIENRKLDRKNKEDQLIYNNLNEFGIPLERLKPALSTSKIRDINSLNDEANRAREMQIGMLSHLLGNGNPRRAFVQFLNSDDLKLGIYTYDVDKIQDFINSSFLSKDKLEEMVANTIRPVDIKNNFERYQYQETYRIMSSSYAADYGKDLDKNDIYKNKDKELVEKYYKEKYFDHYALDKQVDKNRTLFNSVYEYLNYKDAHEKKGALYGLFHPFDNREEKNILKQWKEYIIDNLVPGTNFSNEMLELLEAKGNEREVQANLCRDLISEPVDDEKNKERYLCERDEHIRESGRESKEDYVNKNINSEKYMDDMEFCANYNGTINKDTLYEMFNKYKLYYAKHSFDKKPGFFDFSKEASIYKKEDKYLKLIENKLLMNGVEENLIRDAKKFHDVPKKRFDSFVTLPANLAHKKLFEKISELDDFSDITLNKSTKFEKEYFKAIKPLYDELNIKHLTNKQKTPYQKQQFLEEKELLDKAKKSIMNNINYTEKDFHSLYENLQNKSSARDYFEHAKKVHLEKKHTEIDKEFLNSFNDKDLKELSNYIEQKLYTIEPITKLKDIGPAFEKEFDLSEDAVNNFYEKFQEKEIKKSNNEIQNNNNEIEIEL